MRIGIVACIISLGFACVSAEARAEPIRERRSPAIAEATPLSHPDILKPTDLCLFQGRYVATELMTNRLVSFSSLDLDDIQHFAPEEVGEALRNPHFLAPTRRGTLLISSGWGTSIVEIMDLAGRGWKEFHGLEGGFRAPHGVCVDDAGWIYVGDSLNSRLVRFRDMTGSEWSVFKDEEKRVAYNRQLVYKHDALWVSNSYEDREGLNKGQGGNVLRIRDWESGETEVVFSIPDSNITGVLPGKSAMYVGVWGTYQAVMCVNLETKESGIVPGTRNRLGTPYGIFEDPRTEQAIVTYFGDLEREGNHGGLLALPHPDRYAETLR